MFSDFDSEVVGFDPSVKNERQMNNESSQTLPLEHFSAGTQTTETNCVSTQVVSPGHSNDSVEYDADKLLSFLQRVLPHLEEELHNSESSKGSFSFNEDSDVNYRQSDGGDELEAAQPFSTQIIIRSDFCKGKVISDLTWNSTNVLLAVACSEKSHEGWCNHETSVGLYRTEKGKFEKQPPDHLLKTSSCVRCVQFHPFIPCLLAGGCHSGEVIIWDLTNGETVLTKEKVTGDEEFHIDAVTCLVWRESRDSLGLVSTGRDGKIIFWKVTITNLSYEAVEKFKILKQHSTSLKNSFNEHLEILHIGFWSHKESDFVVAAGENVFHCSLTTTKRIPSNPNYKDPVSMIYKPHEGIVTCVSCSTSDIFASCGMDSKIQIYKFKMIAPLQVIHTNYPLMGINWASNNCLTSWGSCPKVENHKINADAGIHESKTVCDVEDHVSKIAFNSSRQRKMAVGSISGDVIILCDVVL